MSRIADSAGRLPEVRAVEPQFELVVYAGIFHLNLLEAKALLVQAGDDRAAAIRLAALTMRLPAAPDDDPGRRLALFRLYEASDLLPF